MRRFFPLTLTVSAIALTATSVPAADPLRFIPKQADVVLKIESPRTLAENVAAIEPLRQLTQFGAVRELLDSTNSRRFRQLIDYYEKELGAPWPELLDRLAGDGIAVATKFGGGQRAAAVLVVQGRDETAMKEAFRLVRGVIEQEQARQEVKEKPTTSAHRGIEVVHFGPNANAAVVGSALVFSNKKDALTRSLDLHFEGDGESLAQHTGPPEAKKLLDADPLIWMWLNLGPAQRSAEGKEAFALPKGDPAQLILAGTLLDVVGKSPFLAIGVHRHGDDWRMTFRLPRGRDATPPDISLHLAPNGQPGCLPLLEPANVLFSTSFYLDFGQLWSERTRLLKEQPVKEFDMAEKKLGRFLAGRKLSELLTQWGAYHRFVAVAQPKTGYAEHPDQTIPAFAFVSATRDSGFAKAMEPILRVAAFTAGLQTKLKMVEELVDGTKLVGYRFAEDGTLEGDSENARFNFSPCFAAVGEQFFAASTIELGREMIARLKAPGAAVPVDTTTATLTRLYASGGTALLKMFEDQVLAQAVLDRAVTLNEAKRDAELFTAWVRRLGDLRLTSQYRPNDYRLDIDWTRPR